MAQMRTDNEAHRTKNDLGLAPIRHDTKAEKLWYDYRTNLRLTDADG